MTTTSPSNQSVGYKGTDKLIVGIVFGVLTFWLFAMSLLNVAPDIQKSIDISIESLNLAISLTALFSGCFIVVAGGLADRFGRVKFTYIGFILNIIGSLCLVFSTDATLFIIGRIFQGFSAACIMPATLAIMKTYFQDKERQRALSFWSIGSWGGSGLCSFVGGAISTNVGWQWIFILSIIVSILGMLLMKGTPETKADESELPKQFDYSGLFLFVIALFSLNLVINKGSTFGWFSVLTLSLLFVFIIAGIFFFRIEIMKKQKAFIDFSLFKNMPYTGASISNFMLNCAAGTLLIVNSYVQQGRGLTAYEAGTLTIGYLITILLMIRVGEKILQKIGAKKPMLLGTALTGIGIFCMAMTSLPGNIYIGAVAFGYLLFGLGLGLYATPSTDTAISNAPEDRVGVASGIYKMGSSLGGAFGVTISASIYAGFLSFNASIETAAAAGLWTNFLFCILSIVSIIILVPNKAV